MPLTQTYLGIEIGGTKLQLSLVDTDGNTIQNVRNLVDAADGSAGIQTKIAEAIRDTLPLAEITAIGVGFGGPVNWQTGLVRLSHQVNGWADFDVKGWLGTLTGKPVFIENDANVAALAEAVYGAGKEYDKVFYMTIGSGIGGGMIINREIYHGNMPGEAEVGHICLDKKGTTLESQCSGWAVDKKVRKHIKKHPKGLLASMKNKVVGPEASFLLAALSQNNKAAVKIVDEITDDLALALSHVVHLFHPEIIIIGGGLSFLDHHLCAPLNSKLPKYVMKAFLPVPLVCVATLGESAVPTGAAELAKLHWQLLQNH